MDSAPPLIIGRNDFHYVVLSLVGGPAEVRLSANRSMTPAEIAKELRDIADFVESADA